MTEHGYPRVCERYDEKHPGDLAVCERCGAETRVDPADGDPYDRGVRHRDCGGQVHMKWVEGEKCAACGKLDFSMPIRDDHGGYCARRCQLQAEYARTLRNREETSPSAV